jgi:acetoin utilization deacetylase AcuC-like enzyme
MLPIFYSEEFLKHKTGFGHPERPDRLRAIVQQLQRSTWANQIEWHLPSPLSQRDPHEWLLQAHTPTYIEQVRQVSERGGGRLDPDTPLSPESYTVACLAVNAWLDGVDVVLDTQQPAFVLARPPGHHALPDQGMGFCLFANAAIAALYALAQPGIQRVAILDWDVHHGNGTQTIVENHPQIAYCSLHQYPFYPGTGSPQETGFQGTVLNIPMAAGSTIVEYDAVFQSQVMPFLRNFAPDLLIVSAGFDANQDDPLAEVNLRPQDYALLTSHCLSLTSKIVFGLEGGYGLPSLAASVETTIATCLGNVA